jgi:hypothetical protein
MVPVVSRFALIEVHVLQKRRGNSNSHWVSGDPRTCFDLQPDWRLQISEGQVALLPFEPPLNLRCKDLPKGNVIGGVDENLNMCIEPVNNGSIG